MCLFVILLKLMSESLTIIVYQSFQWTSYILMLNFKCWTLNYPTLNLYLKMSVFRTCPGFPSLLFFSFVRFGGAKLHLLFLTTKYFLIYFKNIFFFLLCNSPRSQNYLLISPALLNNSKNGRAKILIVFSFSKYFF